MRIKVAIMIILIVILSNIYLFAFNFNLLVEWNVYIPVVANLKYIKLSEPSFPLAPDVYKVYEYSNPLKKSMVMNNDWNEFNNDSKLDIKEKAVDILDYLEVPNSKRPDFDKAFKYIFKEKNYEELYLFYFEDVDIIYMISRS